MRSTSVEKASRKRIRSAAFTENSGNLRRTIFAIFFRARTRMSARQLASRTLIANISDAVHGFFLLSAMRILKSVLLRRCQKSITWPESSLLFSKKLLKLFKLLQYQIFYVSRFFLSREFIEKL